jgi:YhcH/YjgK/YiaL family protein
MIFDSIDKYKLYTSVHPGFEEAFKFLVTETMLEDGQYVLDGDKLVAYAMTKDTQLSGAAELEYHKKYIDIQYIVTGEEICGLSPMSNLEHLCAYDKDRDIAFLDKKIDDSTIRVGTGFFYIVWPHEPHRPLGAVGNKVETIKKIVIKVAL